MPYINIQDIEPLEVVPGCRMRTPFGENLMLSYYNSFLLHTMISAGTCVCLGDL